MKYHYYPCYSCLVLYIVLHVVKTFHAIPSSPSKTNGAQMTPTSSLFSNTQQSADDVKQQHFTTFDCVIIGGGPAGLATAIAISKASPSSSIAIFEKDDFQPKGASIFISKSGWKSIAELDSDDDHGGSLVKKLKETGIPITDVEFKPWRNEEKDIEYARLGRGLRSMKRYLSKFIQRVFSLFFSLDAFLWHDIRVVLREYAKELYGCGDGQISILNLNCNLENVQPFAVDDNESEKDSSCRFELTFKSTENDNVRKVQAKYLFACDGTNSQVRSLLPNEPNILQAENKSVFRGVSTSFSTSGKATMFRCFSDSDTAGRSAVIFPGGKNVGCSWTVISDIEDGKSRSIEEARSRVLKVIESMGTENNDDYTLLNQVINDSQNVIEHKMYVRDFDQPWESSYDGLTYLGDSAHPVRPTGEGVALAFEDANILRQIVTKKGGLSVEALREYENERFEPVKIISERIRTRANNFYKKSK